MSQSIHTYPVLGMNCAACAVRIEKALQGCQGVISASVNYAAGTASVITGPACSPERLRSAVRAAGYDLTIEAPAAKEVETIQHERYRRLRNRTIAAIALTIPVIITEMMMPHKLWSDIVMAALTTVILGVFGNSFFINAWKQARHGSANMDTLVALSTGIAYLFSMFNMLFPEFWLSRGIHPNVYFEAASVIIAFIMLGRTLEVKAKSNMTGAIRHLMELRPETVTVIDSATGGSMVKGVGSISIGDILLVHPGERIAIDGEVTEGLSYVDESMLTGEPIAVKKQRGDKVFAGTMNNTGSFRYRVSCAGSETLLAKIITTVQEAQGSKAPVQRVVDKIAAVFVPVIIGIAILTLIIWVTAGGYNSFSHGILSMVTVLIIACPCALGLATPTALMVGIGRAARHGILIRDADSIEKAREIDTIVLDKTGTVTEGHPSVSGIRWASADNAAKADILFSMEKRSGHPLSEAIVRHLADCKDSIIDNFENIPGFGISGQHDGITYYAGNRRLMERAGLNIDQDLNASADSMLADAQTVIWFADNQSTLAVIGLSDRIKPSSIEAITQFKANGITPILLTGDNKSAAAAIARQAGIEHFRAEALPSDKSDFIIRLQSEGHKVAMVGDGINDSAALAVADIGIAMGTGSDIAMETAGMTIVSSDLRKIPEAISISKLTLRTIRQNLFWAFIYNVVSIPVAAGVLYPVSGFLLNPMIAGAAMALSSISVVSNSLLLNHIRIQTSSTGHNDRLMKQTYKVTGMMCDHCRRHVEKALNSLDGVAEAHVTLNPPVASVEFSGTELPLSALQKTVTEQAGNYTLTAQADAPDRDNLRN